MSVPLERPVSARWYASVGGFLSRAGSPKLQLTNDERHGQKGIDSSGTAARSPTIGKMSTSSSTDKQDFIVDLLPANAPPAPHLLSHSLASDSLGPSRTASLPLIATDIPPVRSPSSAINSSQSTTKSNRLRRARSLMRFWSPQRDSRLLDQALQSSPSSLQFTTVNANTRSATSTRSRRKLTKLPPMPKSTASIFTSPGDFTASGSNSLNKRGSKRLTWDGAHTSALDLFSNSDLALLPENQPSRSESSQENVMGSRSLSSRNRLSFLMGSKSQISLEGAGQYSPQSSIGSVTQIQKYDDIRTSLKFRLGKNAPDNSQENTSPLMHMQHTSAVADSAPQSGSVTPTMSLNPNRSLRHVSRKRVPRNGLSSIEGDADAVKSPKSEVISRSFSITAIEGDDEFLRALRANRRRSRIIDLAALDTERDIEHYASEPDETILGPEWPADIRSMFIVREICQTEISYVGHLRRLHVMLEQNLATIEFSDSDHSKKTVGESAVLSPRLTEEPLGGGAITRLFGQFSLKSRNDNSDNEASWSVLSEKVGALIPVSEELASRCENDASPFGIAIAFLTMEDTLRAVYSDFAQSCTSLIHATSSLVLKKEKRMSHRARSMGNLERLTEMTPVRREASVAERVVTEKPVRSLEAADIAIMPVQRVLRHVLLLTDLLDKLPDSSSDKKMVQRARDGARATARLCDDLTTLSVVSHSRSASGLATPAATTAATPVSATPADSAPASPVVPRNI